MLRKKSFKLLVWSDSQSVTQRSVSLQSHETKQKQQIVTIEKLEWLKMLIQRWTIHWLSKTVEFRLHTVHQHTFASWQWVQTVFSRACRASAGQVFTWKRTEHNCCTLKFTFLKITWRKWAELLEQSRLHGCLDANTHQPACSRWLDFLLGKTNYCWKTNNINNYLQIKKKLTCTHVVLTLAPWNCVYGKYANYINLNRALKQIRMHLCTNHDALLATCIGLHQHKHPDVGAADLHRWLRRFPLYMVIMYGSSFAIFQRETQDGRTSPRCDTFWLDLN